MDSLKFFFFFLSCSYKRFFPVFTVKRLFYGTCIHCKAHHPIIGDNLRAKDAALGLFSFFPCMSGPNAHSIFFFLNPLQRTEFPFGPGAGLAVLQFRFPENWISPFILCSEQQSDFFFFFLKVTIPREQQHPRGPRLCAPARLQQARLTRPLRWAPAAPARSVREPVGFAVISAEFTSYFL